MKRQTLFLNMYGAMLDAMGPSGWWPAKTPLEMAVGAILTQNTNWQGAAKAVAGLHLTVRVYDPLDLEIKKEVVTLSPEGLGEIPQRGELDDQHPHHSNSR